MKGFDSSIFQTTQYSDLFPNPVDINKLKIPNIVPLAIQNKTRSSIQTQSSDNIPSFEVKIARQVRKQLAKSVQNNQLIVDFESEEFMDLITLTQHFKLNFPIQYLAIMNHQCLKLDFIPNFDVVTLRIPFNNIVDLSPVFKQNNLVELQAYNNKIRSLKGISRLQKLQVLNVSHNNLKRNGILEIRFLFRLKEFSIKNNKCENFVDLMVNVQKVNGKSYHEQNSDQIIRRTHYQKMTLLNFNEDKIEQLNIKQIDTLETILKIAKQLQQIQIGILELPFIGQ